VAAPKKGQFWLSAATARVFFAGLAARGEKREIKILLKAVQMGCSAALLCRRKLCRISSRGGSDPKGREYNEYKLVRGQKDLIAIRIKGLTMGSLLHRLSLAAVKRCSHFAFMYKICYAAK